MKLISFQVSDDLWINLRKRMSDVESIILALPSGDDRNRLLSALSMRGVCSALLSDGLDSRTAPDVAAMLRGQYVRQGRAPIDAASLASQAKPQTMGETYRAKVAEYKARKAKK